MAEIFNKLANTLNKGVATVGASSKAAMDKSKINSAISNLEKEKADLTYKLGEQTYNLYKQTSTINVTEDIQGLIDNIDKRIALIKEKENELAAIEKELLLITKGTAVEAPADAFICSCSHPNNKDAKFCAKCGSNLTEQKETKAAATSTSDDTITCSCEHKNPATAKFCSGCGTSLS